jgi:ATP-dependent DNA ligase
MIIKNIELPTLYKLNASGTKWMIWNAQVYEKESNKTCIIKRLHGYEDGKMTHSEKEINKGKNIGKRNETSIYEQACNEAKSMWLKQRDIQKYAESKTNVIKHPQPMLAHSFEKQSSKIKYPCFTQPKLDGVRMICNSYVCISRTGKEFATEPLSYILSDIRTVVQNHPFMETCYFDGELYTPELCFEDIVGACRTNVKHDENKYKLLRYHIYDIIPTQEQNKNLTYEKRYEILKEIFNEQYKYLDFVVSCKVEFEKDIFEKHEEYLINNYEGIMIRNTNGSYQQSRSYNLQKYKHFTDEEYEIVDVKEATGNDTGTAILQCKTKNDLLFWVRPKGSREYRASILQDDTIKHKLLTVRYQNLTDKGIPRFPVGVVIRDYE